MLSLPPLESRPCSAGSSSFCIILRDIPSAICAPGALLYRAARCSKSSAVPSGEVSVPLVSRQPFFSPDFFSLKGNQTELKCSPTPIRQICAGGGCVCLAWELLKCCIAASVPRPQLRLRRLGNVAVPALWLHTVLWLLWAVQGLLMEPCRP